MLKGKHLHSTIGLLSGRAASGLHFDLWSGVADATADRSADLFCFAGKYLHDPDGFSAQGNVIYELVDQERIDGLVIWTSSLGNYISREALRDFCNRYRPLPMIGVGLKLEGIPGVLVDSYGGMREAVVHLIEAHGRRRLAFIRGLEGHREAEERYRAYADVLRQSGLAVEPDLVSPSLGWGEAPGVEAIRILLDDRQVHFDAVVAASDDLALGALSALQARGIRVPDDVAIVGFNDVSLAKITTPPLTTIPIRMYERGRQAAKMLFALLDGEQVPDQVSVPTHLVKRQSCGCLDSAVAEVAELAHPGVNGRASQIQAAAAIDDSFASKRERALAELCSLENIAPEYAQRFLDAFLAALEQESPRTFLSALQDILRQVVKTEGEITASQSAISVLQYRVAPYLLENREARIRAETLWHQARVMIGEIAQRAQGHHGWQAQQQAGRLRTVSQLLATTTSLTELANVLARELPQLGICSCYLSLYEDPKKPTEWSRLLLAYDETGRTELVPPAQRFPSRQLVPDDLLSPTKRRNMVVEPLYFRDEQLGFVLLECGLLEGDAYETLRDEISNALKGVLLLEESNRLYRQARDAQQVAEEANRLKSRFLSMVSHELRAPLVLLVGLSEIMLHEYGGQLSLPEPYRQDLQRIHVGAQQLDGLIRDVLDLTRSQMGQLKLTQKPVDLGEVLQAVALVGEQLARGKRLHWKLAISPTLPQVWGDPARLQQVALNLVTNAIKFTLRGEVSLKAEAGDGIVTVSISDTGLGVPREDQEVIFDEFRQSERTVARGYGGLGLGLAICRQLVELHGGKIGIQSSGTEHGGSTFYFTLPTIGDHVAANTATGDHAKRVLLLTEGESNGTRVQKHLVREGFAVELLRINETPDWLARTLSSPPGAVVLDLQPASEQGWEVMQALRENPATQHIPVLFYSLLPDSGSVLSLDYLSKPVGATALTQALQSYGLGVGDGQGAILIVDDDSAILDMHTRMVQTHAPNCRVLQAANGKIAIEAMRREQPALVLLDLMMPEMNGFDVLETMQKDETLRDIPVIVLTAQRLTHEDMARLNRGVAAVLGKGLFSPVETLAQIERVLARNKNMGSESQRAVYQVMAFIHERYTEPISRQDMAAYAGVSARHLTRCFCQETGVSPITYLQRYRVKQAKRLLQDRTMSVTQVALAVGFSDGSYFARAFRREVGISPSVYQAGK